MKETFKSRYRFRKARVDSIPSIKALAVDTSYSDERLVTEVESRMIAVGATEVIAEDITAEYDQDNMPAFIDIYGNQLAGDQFVITKEHGNVVLKREYPNKARELPREKFPFAKYETATEANIDVVRDAKRRIDKVDGIVFDLLSKSVPDSVEPYGSRRPPNYHMIQHPRKTREELNPVLLAELKELCAKVDTGKDTDEDLDRIAELNKQLYGKR